MHAHTTLLLSAVLTGSLALSGCGRKDDHANTDTHAGHDHGEHGHTHDEQGGHTDHADHGAERSLGSVEIAGSTFAIKTDSDLEPGASLHLHIDRAGGPVPAAVRLWVGEESGTGSVKSKADESDGGYHAEAEVPDTVDENTALWIEVETESGEKVLGRVQLGG